MPVGPKADKHSGRLISEIDRVSGYDAAAKAQDERLSSLFRKLRNVGRTEHTPHRRLHSADDIRIALRNMIGEAAAPAEPPPQRRRKA